MDNTSRRSSSLSAKHLKFTSHKGNKNNHLNHPNYYISRRSEDPHRIPTHSSSSSRATTHPVPQREDAQPNEQSSWLPHRLRRPIEPPVIKPANASISSSSSFAKRHYHPAHPPVSPPPRNGYVAPYRPPPQPIYYRPGSSYVPPYSYRPPPLSLISPIPDSSLDSFRRHSAFDSTLNGHECHSNLRRPDLHTSIRGSSRLTKEELQPAPSGPDPCSGLSSDHQGSSHFPKFCDVTSLKHEDDYGQLTGQRPKIKSSTYSPVESPNPQDVEPISFGDSVCNSHKRPRRYQAEGFLVSAAAPRTSDSVASPQIDSQSPPSPPAIQDRSQDENARPLKKIKISDHQTQPSCLPEPPSLSRQDLTSSSTPDEHEPQSQSPRSLSSRSSVQVLSSNDQQCALSSRPQYSSVKTPSSLEDPSFTVEVNCPPCRARLPRKCKSLQTVICARYRVRVTTCLNRDQVKTEQDAEKLIRRVLGSVGSIATITVVHLLRKKCTCLRAIVSFEEASAAEDACSTRSFHVPSTYRYKNHPLNVFRNVPMKVSCFAISSQSHSKSPKPTDIVQPPRNQSDDSFVPESQKLSNDQGSHSSAADNNSDHCSSNNGSSVIVARSHSRSMRNSLSSTKSCNRAFESNRSQRTVGDEHEFEVLPSNRPKIDLSPGSNVFDQKTPRASRLRNSVSLSKKTIKPSSGTSTSLLYLRLEDVGSTPFNEVYARSVVASTCTCDAVIDMTRNFLGEIGQILDIRIAIHCERSKCSQTTLIVTFKEPSAARKACALRHFPIPEPYHYKGNMLIIYPKIHSDAHRASKNFGINSMSGREPKPQIFATSCHTGLASDGGTFKIPEPAGELDTSSLGSSSNPAINESQDSHLEEIDIQADSYADLPRKKKSRHALSSLPSSNEAGGPKAMSPRGKSAEKKSVKSRPKPEILSYPSKHSCRTESVASNENESQMDISSSSSDVELSAEPFRHSSNHSGREESVDSDDIESRSPLSSTKAVAPNTASFTSQNRSSPNQLVQTDDEDSEEVALPQTPQADRSKKLDDGDDDIANLPADSTSNNSRASSSKSSPQSINNSTRERSASTDHSDSEDQPLWHRDNNRLAPRSQRDLADYLEENSINKSCEQTASVDGSCAGESIPVISSPLLVSASEPRPKQVRVKGHFRLKGCLEDRNEKVADFLRGLFQPFGEILAFKLRYPRRTLVQLDLIYKDPRHADQALKSSHKNAIPANLACPGRSAPILDVSVVHPPDISPLIDQWRLQQDTMSRSCSVAPMNSACRNDASGSNQPPRHPSKGCINSSPQDELTIAAKEHPRSSTPSNCIGQNSCGPIELSTNNPSLSQEAGLSLKIFKYKFPRNCHESHNSFAVNRLHFKLEKIRFLTAKNQTVLESSWDSEHLILHAVLDPESVEPSRPRSLSDSIASRAFPPHSLTSDSGVELHEGQGHEFCQPHVCRSVTPSTVPFEKSFMVSRPKPKHRTWPFDATPGFIDNLTFPDFQKTLNDFLTTFFRLWEESRSDLRSLYDESAVFSNILAKQGRKASAVTKRTGWLDIHQSIRKLPALSNGPMAELIKDACLISLDPPRVMCSIHGSFSEFPKSHTRAFDRTLILRPVDVHLHPSEGCLGLLKWIILSDTLTIRKHTQRIKVMTESFLEKQKTQTGLYARSGSHDEQLQVAIQDNLHPCLPRGRPEGDRRDRSSSSLIISRSSCSPLRLPLCLAPPTGPSTQATLHQSTTDAQTSADYHPQSASQGAEQSVSSLAQVQSQLRTMQAEIERLKHATGVSSPFVPTATQTEEIVTLPELPSRKASTDQDELPNSELPSEVQDLDDLENHEDNDSTRPIKVTNSTSYRHIGFGVSKKRLLIPTNLSQYLIISMRGDILTWSQDDVGAGVDLVMSGASPTDIVDSACYSSPSNTLILGSRTSTTAKRLQFSIVNLVKFTKSSNGDLSCNRIQFDDPIHENGVRATCLTPKNLFQHQNSHDSCSLDNYPDSPLGFVTAGFEKFIALWKVQSVPQRRRHRSRRKRYAEVKCGDEDNELKEDQSEMTQKKITKIYTDHTSLIQTLSVYESRNWVLSGGQDGKIYATDLGHSNSQTLLIKEKCHIFDIQRNPTINETFVVTTASKTSCNQFRYCDFRTSKPAFSFGIPSDGPIGMNTSPVNFYRKGSLRDYFFSYPNGENGGVLLWDLRFLKPSPIPISSSTSSSSSLTKGMMESTNPGKMISPATTKSNYQDFDYLKVPNLELLNTSHGVGIQSYFESLDSIVVLEKEFLTRSKIEF